MELESCETIREAVRGCGLVLLTATLTEAEPMLSELKGPESHEVATKTLFVGQLATGRVGADGGETAASVRTALAVGGCDKANTAHVLTCLLQAMQPKPLLVLQVGVAGAFPHRGPGMGAGVGDIVLATEEIYSDTGSSSPDGWLSAEELGLPMARVRGRELGGRFILDPRLVREAATVIKDSPWTGTRPGVLIGPCVTSSRATGLRAEGEELATRWGAAAESMEGAAAAHVCALYEVPFLELRCISNLVVDRDRSSWELDRAVQTAGRAALVLVAGLDRLPLTAAWFSGGDPSQRHRERGSS